MVQMALVRSVKMISYSISSTLHLNYSLQLILTTVSKFYVKNSSAITVHRSLNIMSMLIVYCLQSSSILSAVLKY